jgi:hypothetical protein
MVEPSCGRERSGRPQAKSRVQRGISHHTALTILLAAHPTTSLHSVAQCRLESEPAERSEGSLTSILLSFYLWGARLSSNPSEFSLVRKMRQSMVDDVPHRCYSYKVPRVKSGLPVRGWFSSRARACVEGAEKKQLSFRDPRLRKETPSGDALAETSCAHLHPFGRLCGTVRAKRSTSRGWLRAWCHRRRL